MQIQLQEKMYLNAIKYNCNVFAYIEIHLFVSEMN